MFKVSMHFQRSKIWKEKFQTILDKVNVRVASKDLRNVENLKKVTEMTENHWNQWRVHSRRPKRQNLTFALEYRQKLSYKVVKHSLEKFILPNFVNFSTIFCPRLYIQKYLDEMKCDSEFQDTFRFRFTMYQEWLR